MNALFMLFLFLQTGPAELPEAVPSAQQIDEIRALVRKTENRDIELKAELKKLQQQLTDAYAQFELDEAGIRAIHRKIVDTQEQLLVNYHTLQFGYRRIIGPKHFARVKIRIDHYVRTAEERRKKQRNQTDEVDPESDRNPDE